MPGGGKGPTQTGTVQQQVVNPTAQAQLPSLQSAWDSAKGVFQNLNWIPPAIQQGYSKIAAQAANGQPLVDSAQNYLQTGLGGGQAVGNSPAYNALSQLQVGGTPQQQALQGNAGALSSLAGTTNPYYTTGANELAGLSSGIQNPYYGMGANSLSNTAAGNYLNANPYVNSMFNSAAGNVTRQYQTATSPQTDSSYETAGRYGSGSLGNATGQNNLDLGVNLNNLASNIYGTNYANERQLQNSAAGTLGQLGLGLQNAQTSAANSLGALGQSQQSLQGSQLNAAGNLYGNLVSGLGSAAQTLQSGYNAGNANMNALAGMYPNIQNAGYVPGQQMVAAGLGSQAAPYSNIADYLGIIGNPLSGSSTTTSPILGPNALSTGLGLAGGVGSLANSGLFGGLGGSGAPMFDAATQASIADVAAGGMGAADVGGGGGKALSSLLPAIFA